MGFYDKSIKKMMKRCPRLVVLALNSIFDKNYDEDSEIVFLDKELPESHSSTYMDMLIGVGDDEFHWEFQLSEGHMSIRMYEYGMRESIRRLDRENNESKYELYVEMPEQVVVFLAGVNKRDEITVTMRLPDRQTVTYRLPCVSASVSVDRLVEDKLYMLIPFQQVQLNERMNRISSRSSKTKLKMAREIHEYHIQVKPVLENLKNNVIITTTEYEILTETFSNVEKYLREKDNEVDKVVSEMGDENYVSWTDRTRATLEEEVRAEAKAEAEKQRAAWEAEVMAEVEKQLAEKDEQLTEQGKRLAETEEENRKLKEMLVKMKS